MLKAIGFLYLISYVLLPPLLLLDVHMYPVCPQCGDNLRSRRQRFRATPAYCQRHGTFEARIKSPREYLAPFVSSIATLCRRAA